MFVLFLLLPLFLLVPLFLLFLLNLLFLLFLLVLLVLLIVKYRHNLSLSRRNYNSSIDKIGCVSNGDWDIIVFVSFSGLIIFMTRIRNVYGINELCIDVLRLRYRTRHDILKMNPIRDVASISNNDFYIVDSDSYSVKCKAR